MGLSALFSACTDDHKVLSDATCRQNEKSYEGKCYDINACLPPCDENTQKCYQGSCYSKNVCMPECDEETEKCANGECIGKDVCYPACNPETHVCNNGSCEPIDPTACIGKQCKNSTTYCDETGHWNACEPGYGCHLGYCLKGLAPECEDNTCSADNTRECQGGNWVPCGSMESCVDGKCKLEDIACEPQSCSEDKAYYCSDDNVFKPCSVGTICNNGRCEISVDKDDAFLWKRCESNADCPRGVCVFDVSASRTMSVAQLGIENADIIPLSALDNRIAPGTGVCAADCTRDASICDYISTDATKYTCQIIVTGDSPYPPKDDYLMDMSLPFHSRLSIEDMSISPYGSICRPNDPKGKAYQKSFCKSCESIDDCSGSEACIHNMCLQPCSNTEQCPFSFTCRPPDNMETGYCMPNAGSCGACIDRDGDGQGYGACEKRGFDCDDNNYTIYYGKTLTPDSCTMNYTDNNCNGKVDFLELIGSPDNCDTCSSTCKVGENANHITRVCELDNGDKALDDSTPETVAETYKYGCFDYCAPGYADCNNDVSDGCETKLYDVGSNGNHIPTEDAVYYTMDTDGDGHGIVDNFYAHFCCKSTEGQENKVCYAEPNTDANVKEHWERAVLNKDHYSSVIDDCDDNNDLRFPGNPEICDGIDNDCNADTPDGDDALVKLSNHQYVAATSADSNTYKLDAECILYETNSGNVCNEHGRITCMARASGGYEMICYAPTSEKDGGHCNGDAGEDCCNGVDDNCNGQIDEDFVMTACDTSGAGICQMGVSVCDGPNNVVCKQLFEPRPYDFYGDGIDSDCDGYDWDYDNAVYIARYGGGLFDGNDETSNHHTGKANSPFATLTKAFEVAAFTIEGKSFYKDIIVSNSVASMTAPEALWGKTPINVPTLASTSVFSPVLFSAISHDAHVENYKKAIQNNQIYKANDWLYPNEVYPPKETVRIYGGFKKDGVVWNVPGSNSYSEYQYNINESETNSDGSLKANHYELLRPNGMNPLSLKLDRFNLTIQAAGDVYAKQSGTTFVGIDCGRYGCKDLSLVNTFVTVKGAPGLLTPQTFLSNENWVGNRNGVDGHWYELPNGGAGWYYANFLYNSCLSHFFNEEWFPFTIDSYYNQQMCPDGNIPRGGCGGAWCCGWRVGDSQLEDCMGYVVVDDGLSGLGANGGAGAVLDVYTNDGCNSDATVDKNKSVGVPGFPGAGGAGGDNRLLRMDFSIAANDVYVATYSGTNKDDTSAANGHPGQSGSGGGGGGVYHCFDRKTAAKPHWMFAGSGGAGGCGGYGGMAGGTGGSGIGIILIPPKSGESNIQLTDKGVVVTSANGGNGHEGQDGVRGGQGGKAIGYADEYGGVDYHCHKGTAGGAGGAGGGGGGGAGGLAGEAYGFMFLCNRNVANYSGIADLSKCGFIVDRSFLESPEQFSILTAGMNGGQGVDGSWGIWDTSVDETENKFAVITSQGGMRGMGGTTRTSYGKSSGYVLIKTTAF